MARNYEKQVQLTINKLEKIVSSEKTIIKKHEKILQETEAELKVWQGIQNKYDKLQSEIEKLTTTQSEMFSKGFSDSNSDF